MRQASGTQQAASHDAASLQPSIDKMVQEEFMQQPLTEWHTH